MSQFQFCEPILIYQWMPKCVFGLGLTRFSYPFRVMLHSFHPHGEVQIIIELKPLPSKCLNHRAGMFHACITAHFLYPYVLLKMTLFGGNW